MKTKLKGGRPVYSSKQRSFRSLRFVWPTCTNNDEVNQMARRAYESFVCIKSSAKIFSHHPVPCRDEISSHTSQIPGIAKVWLLSSTWHETCPGIHEPEPTAGKREKIGFAHCDNDTNRNSDCNCELAETRVWWSFGGWTTAWLIHMSTYLGER